MILESPAFNDQRPLSLASHITRIQINGLSPREEKMATTLRLKRARELDAGGARMILLAIRPHVKDEKLAALNCTSADNIWRLAKSVGKEMLSSPDAKWWIANKDLKPYHNIVEATKTVLARFTKIRPFG